jgi:radical SAM superfamily enzyme YgiQ (UPF0313 family)
LHHDLEIGRLIKQWHPEATTGVMGTHVSVNTAQALAAPGIDVVIRREPEQTIRRLCGQAMGAWGGVPGISYISDSSGPSGPEKRLVENPDNAFMPPGSIPAPAWQFLDLTPYRLPLKGRRFLIVAPIRGCPFPCTFCTARIYYGKPLRKRPVTHVVEELETGIRRHGVRNFFIWADTFTADRQYVLDICGAIAASGLNIRWTCNSRVDTVDREMLEAMKKAGLWMISYGLESGDQGVLDRCGKRISLGQSRQAVSMAKQLGIRVSGHFILGLPGDTPQTLRQTLGFALGLPLDIVQFYAAAVFPGTRLHTEAVEMNWLRKEAGQSQDRASMDLPGLGAEALDAFRKRAYRRYYLRIPALWRLVRMVEPAAATNVLANLKGFMQWARG